MKINWDHWDVNRILLSIWSLLLYHSKCRGGVVGSWPWWMCGALFTLKIKMTVYSLSLVDVTSSGHFRQHVVGKHIYDEMWYAILAGIK